MTRASQFACLAVLGLTLTAADAAAQVGRRIPSERKVINDDVTGLPLTVLTDGTASDAKIYQTHPQWAADGKHIIFRTGGRAPGSQAYAVNEQTGDIVQLTEGAGNDTGSLNIARKSMKLYFLRNPKAAAAGVDPTPATRPARGATTGPSTAPAQQDDPTLAYQMIELDVARVLADSAAGTMKPAREYERLCATLPAGLRSAGGFGLDADEKFAYLGVRGGDTGKHLPPGVEVMQTPPGARMGAGPAGLRSINLETGEVKVIIDTPFLMGHVQTNPWVPGEIIYCYETGGDGSQRMWTVKADGTGNRPLFEEGPLDWVTHEAVVTKDEVMFNLIGHQKRLRVRPTGIAIVNLRSNAVTLLDQIDERNSERDDLPSQNSAGPDSYGGYWHCNGSADGRWAVGDTFTGNLWLIDRKDGQRVLLTTDHKMRPDHLHPTFDDASTKILVQSGKWTDGQRLQLVVVPVPQVMIDKKPISLNAAQAAK